VKETAKLLKLLTPKNITSKQRPFVMNNTLCRVQLLGSGQKKFENMTNVHQ
jgi:hypothetical protein